jgi:hypothetical protein
VFVAGKPVVMPNSNWKTDFVKTMEHLQAPRG